MIIYPDTHAQAFEDIKSKLYEAPLTIAELTCLRDLVEDRLKEERDEFHLFTVGDRTRENVRQQFHILCQALELDAIGVTVQRPQRQGGDLRWKLCHRSSLIQGVLVLRSDDTWAIETRPISETKRKAMTDAEYAATIEFGKYSLSWLLSDKNVNKDGLGGWKLAQ